MVPYLGLLGLEVAAATIGAATITAFVVWISIPGQQAATSASPTSRPPPASC